MPICEVDPWRFQYFENVACPPDVNISTEDFDSWEWFPAHRWIYHNLFIARTAGPARRSQRGLGLITNTG